MGFPPRSATWGNGFTLLRRGEGCRRKGLRRVELVVEVDERILGDTIIIEVPWDMVKRLNPILEEGGAIVLSSRDRRYRVAAGNTTRLYEGVRLLHQALSWLERMFLN
jgi:hypothetical protein